MAFIDPSGLLTVGQYGSFAKFFISEGWNITSNSMNFSIFNAGAKLSSAWNTFESMTELATLYLACGITEKELLDMFDEHLENMMFGDIRYIVENIALFDPSLELTEEQVENLGIHSARAYQEGVNIAALTKTLKSVVDGMVVKQQTQHLLNAATKAEALNSLDSLPAAIKDSAKSFFKKGSNKYSDFSIIAEKNQYIMSMTKPGNVPGSYAVYTKTVSGTGDLISAIKTTYDPAGNIVHAKKKG